MQGSFTDAALVTKLAADADIVINAADSDDAALLGAILAGLKKRYDEGKGVGSYIHTSGSAIYWDTAAGKYDPESRVWSVSARARFRAYGP